MPVNFKDIPTTGKRSYKSNNISRINEGLRSLPLEQRAAIIGTIIEESGGDPFAISSNGTYKGLLQWGADRYVPKSNDANEELNNQIQHILSTINNTKGGVNWTHGGKGSGYSTMNDTYKAFNNKDLPFKDRFRAFSYGYVRPQGKEDSYNNRLKVAQEVLNRLVVEENLSKPQTSNKWTPKPFKQPTQFSFKYDDGGYLNNGWNSLSYADKAEMMKVAVANGITTLPEIRNAYNEFAKGGYKPSSKIQKDIATWEGSEMKRNRPFSEMTQQFNAVVPKELQSRLSSNQLDALYSYGYNVGMGNLKERVLPTLNAYAQGKATNEDVQKSMWATKDSQLRGLAKRRSWERDMFGGAYRAPFSKSSTSKGLGSHIDSTNLGMSPLFYNNLGNSMENIVLPQMGTPLTSVDPETLYKAPTIDNTLFADSTPTVNEPMYDSKQDRLEGIQRFNTIMNLMGQKSPFSMLGDSFQGIMPYVNTIYGS